MSKQKTVHAPTLTTIRMVEDTLKTDSLFTIPELKRALPKQVNHTTLMMVIDYLEESGKIYMSRKGITWIYNMNPNLAKMIERGTEH